MVQHADGNEMQNYWKKKLKIISEFSEVAGPLLNLEKTECLLTGSLINMCVEEWYTKLMA